MEGLQHRVPPSLTSNQKGAIAEAGITWEAIKLGIDVYRPVAEGGRYDLIFGVGNELLRVQCKWATRLGDVVNVRLQTSRRARGGALVRRTYTEQEIDAVVAYCPELETCYFLPAALISGRFQLYLRLSATRNQQKSGVKWAAEYELGAIAQLGERLGGTQEVAGSSPASST
jgi:hypothetical protein